MKKSQHPDSQPPAAQAPPPSSRKKGFAIITVLGVLVIVAVLVVAFLTMANDELTSSKKYSEGLRVRQLRDIAMNVVIAQIQEATSFEDTAWASGPGQIRIFQNGEMASAYKLYSSNKMVVSSSQELLTDYERGWDTDPANWIDLNEPVVKDDSTSFPIVDPRAFSTDAQQSVEGFSYRSGEVNGIVEPTGSAEESTKKQRLPMPVRWIYVLGDGSLGTLNQSQKFEGPRQPTEGNPIVGRIGFWTDDESGKVNLNTASHGTFWDTPRADNDQERNFGRYQPVVREWQRYPGHPAMTSLAPIFFPNRDLDPETASDVSLIEDIYQIAPRIQPGGSRQGTVPSEQPIEASRDRARLYASLDEVLFSTELRGGDREENDVLQGGGSSITRQLLERSKFFLTVNSRAPEVTLWGTPRMCIWPLHEVDSISVTRSPYDRLIAFCSEAGRAGNRKFKYYYQRQDQNSRHWDYYRRDMYDGQDWYGRNVQIFDYIAKLLDRPVPGYEQSIARKLANYTDLSDSGTSKYGEAQQVLAEIFDYIKSSNLVDGSVSQPYGRRGSTGSGSFNAQVAGICMCGGSPIHTNIWNRLWSRDPKGFGRIYSASEVALVFLTRAVKSFNSEGEETRFGNPQDLEIIRPNQRWIEIGVLVEGFCPAQGFAMIQPQCGWILQSDQRHASFRGATISGVPIDTFIGDQSVSPDGNNRPGGPAGLTSGSSASLTDWFGWGGYGGYRMFKQSGVYSSDARVPEDKRIILPSQRRSMTVDLRSGQQARIVTYDVNSTGSMSTGNLLQDIRVQFETFTSPVPEIVLGAGSNWWRWRTRMQRANLAPGTESGQLEGAVIRGDNTDVVRSMVVSHGDYRLIAGKRNIDARHFAPANGYFDQGEYLAHSLVGSSSSDMAPGKKDAYEVDQRSYVAGVSYDKKIVPDFPLSPDNPLFAQLAPQGYPYSLDPGINGDFDNGIGNCPDGPYINKADDGVTPSGTAYFDATTFSGSGSGRSNFSPNRMMPSPGMFGSLSSGIQAHIPWRTLLFRPMPEDGHFGQENPPDHIWMDLFWMPTVEPYAVSESFSTAGKINLNYQIVPFTYIRRASGIHAILESERITAFPNTDGNIYKTGAGGRDYRMKIDPEQTLQRWDEKFSGGGFFKSATEICDMYLIPEGESGSTIERFWENHRLTGDNTRERVYATIYPRVTTKSNTYKVHMAVQTLVKARSTAIDTFVPGKDKITSEYRGASIIERYIDPNDPAIPDYVKEEDAEPLDLFYRFRILTNTRFAP